MALSASILASGLRTQLISAGVLLGQQTGETDSQYATRVTQENAAFTAISTAIINHITTYMEINGVETYDTTDDATNTQSNGGTGLVS